MDFQVRIGQNNFIIARVRAYIVKHAPDSRRFGAKTAIIALNLCLFSLGAFVNVLAADPTLQNTLHQISDQNLNVSLPAIEKLGQSKDPEVMAALMQAFSQEQRPVVRRYIVDALGCLKNIGTLPILKIALKDPDPQIRLSAISALGLLSGPEVDDALIQAAAQENHPGVKAHLAYQLQWSGHARASAVLQNLANDADPQVKKFAEMSIRNRQQQAAPSGGQDQK